MFPRHWKLFQYMKEFLHENESKQNICFSLQIVDINYSDLKHNLELKAKLKFERINHTLYYSLR